MYKNCKIVRSRKQMKENYLQEYRKISNKHFKEITYLMIAFQKKS